MMIWLYWMVPVIFEIGLISVSVYLGYVFKVRCNYTKTEMSCKLAEFMLVHTVYVFATIAITFICQSVDIIFKGQVGLIVLPFLIASVFGFISFNWINVNFIEINEELGRVHRRKLRKEIKL